MDNQIEMNSGVCTRVHGGDISTNTSQSFMHRIGIISTSLLNHKEIKNISYTKK